ncbi:hypothetical protein [Amycolatopsis sp. NPDC051371]|uniref:hypothetical protein n=1 Tax=Amycolatopsis sp. NPDC051371 TaxID=3155800 RepID=UPI00342DCB5C
MGTRAACRREWCASAGLPLDGEVAAIAARMSGLLLSRESVDAVLELIVAPADATIPGAAGPG